MLERVFPTSYKGSINVIANHKTYLLPAFLRILADLVRANGAFGSPAKATSARTLMEGDLNQAKKSLPSSEWTILKDELQAVTRICR